MTATLHVPPAPTTGAQAPGRRLSRAGALALVTGAALNTAQPS